MFTELVAAHAFNAGAVVYFLSFSVYCLNRAALHTHSAAFASFQIDPGPGLKEVYYPDY